MITCKTTYCAVCTVMIYSQYNSWYIRGNPSLFYQFPVSVLSEMIFWLNLCWETLVYCLWYSKETSSHCKYWKTNLYCSTLHLFQHKGTLLKEQLGQKKSVHSFYSEMLAGFKSEAPLLINRWKNRWKLGRVLISQLNLWPPQFTFIYIQSCEKNQAHCY